MYGRVHTWDQAFERCRALGTPRFTHGLGRRLDKAQPDALGVGGQSGFTVIQRVSVFIITNARRASSAFSQAVFRAICKDRWLTRGREPASFGLR
jgi:hypothetical protein